MNSSRPLTDLISKVSLRVQSGEIYETDYVQNIGRVTNQGTSSMAGNIMHPIALKISSGNVPFSTPAPALKMLIYDRMLGHSQDVRLLVPPQPPNSLLSLLFFVACYWKDYFYLYPFPIIVAKDVLGM